MLPLIGSLPAPLVCDLDEGYGGGVPARVAQQVYMTFNEGILDFHDNKFEVHLTDT